ncbi:MAG: NAD-dependent epimerase/dehydratase family protein [Vicinamibacterales bacterium]
MGLRRPMPAETGSTTSIAITGASGALGRYVVRDVLDARAGPVRALTHATPLPDDLRAAGVGVHQGSLLDRPALDRWLAPGATVIHLAYPWSMTPEDHRRAIQTLADACAAAGVRRVVHCSTAVVVGRARSRQVTEATPCEPVTPYERIKYDLEQVFTAAARGRFPLVIARPTAIVGPGLRNLVALLTALTHGSPVANFLRASLYGARGMHLVPAETVARALRFLALDLPDDVLAAAEAAGAPARFLVSTDQHPGGDFRTVHARLRAGLGLGAPAPAAPVPPVVLSLILRVTGRSDTDPHRVYDGSALERAGFVAPVTLADALDRYAAWWRDHERRGEGSAAG